MEESTLEIVVGLMRRFIAEYESGDMDMRDIESLAYRIVRLLV